MERRYHLSELPTVVSELVTSYGAPSREHALVWALRGDLGAGKTTLVQALALHFGIVESVTSPTFILEKIYDLTDAPFKRLVHIDAYRFEDPKEASVLRLGESISSPANFIVLEWPERMGDLLPSHTHFFEIGIVDETTRLIRHA